MSKQIGIAARFIASFSEKDAQEIRPLDEVNRVLALGPQRGPEDTLEARLTYLREMDAKAVKH